MDSDIHFGDLEEQQPESQLRPDQNKQYVVAAYQEPIDGELPIFVDLDCFRDMEVHALTDTSIELGGVLLGGQYQDDEETPFVVVGDSLRAAHYEATKGSFKFTHDTWEQISRQRDELPDDLQMVGWYHTHPDWGVFLSGMDMFICDNFFNRPLDVALVIDPCRRDRAMFEWTGDESNERIRRQGGFYVYTSRHREAELRQFVAQLEMEPMMSSDPRFSNAAGGYGAPVVNVARPAEQSPIIPLGIMAMLTMQFLLLTFIGWKLFIPSESEEVAKKGKQIAALKELHEKENEIAYKERELQAQRVMLDRLIEQSADQPGIVKQLEDARKTVARLKDDEVVYRAQTREIQDDLARLDLQLTREVKARERQTELAVDNKTKLSKTIKELNTAKKALETAEERVADLEKERGYTIAGYSVWLWVGLVLGSVVIVGAIVVFSLRRENDELDEKDPNVSPPPANNGREESSTHEISDESETKNDAN